MNLILVGTNHKYSPIELRERISFSRRRLGEALGFLRDHAKIESAVIISTCNRIEIYGSCKESECGLDGIEDFLSAYHEIRKEEIAPYLYRYIDEDALRHLFEVACGLDSQVLGETQVLGQARSSYEESKRFGFTDRVIDYAFGLAIELGRLVRTKTDISKGNVSIGSVAMDFVKREVKDLQRKKVLIIGLGKVSELVIKYLSKEKVQAILVSNKTYEKAKAIAESIGAKAVRFDNLKEYLRDADIVISATSSPHVVLKKEDLIGLVNERLLILDLALPRDVDPNVRDLKGVELFNLEDLNSVVDENITKRKSEAEKARAIIDREADRLWVKLTESEPELARLP